VREGVVSRRTAVVVLLLMVAYVVTASVLANYVESERRTDTETPSGQADAATRARIIHGVDPDADLRPVLWPIFEEHLEQYRGLRDRLDARIFLFSICIALFVLLAWSGRSEFQIPVINVVVSRKWVQAIMSALILDNIQRTEDRVLTIMANTVYFLVVLGVVFGAHIVIVAAKPTWFQSVVIATAAVTLIVLVMLPHRGVRGYIKLF
jgi:hypothetical protein